MSFTTPLLIFAVCALAYWSGRLRPVERARAWNDAHIDSDRQRTIDSLVWYVLHPLEGGALAQEQRAEREELTASTELEHELFDARDTSVRR